MDLNEMRKRFKAKQKQGHIDDASIEDVPFQEIDSQNSNEKTVSKAKSEPILVKEVGGAKVGNVSEVSISEPSYNFVYGEDNLTFECSRLDNLSEETTGTLYVSCWISEKERLNGEWQNDNYALVDSIELGYLDSGYGFPDLNITFRISDELLKLIDSCFEDGEELHFIFTVNELHEDGNKYIIYYVNGPNENEEESVETTDDEESDVASIVRSIIVDKLGVDECDAVDEASFMDDLGADSLDAVELIMEFENEFGITIPDDDAMRIKTIGQAIRYIEQHL